MKMKILHRSKHCRRFTLVELMTAMSVFAVLMLILMQIFGSTQDVWRRTNSKAESYESTRNALSILQSDLYSASYSPSYKRHFYFNNTKPTSGKSTMLWFPTRKNYLQIKPDKDKQPRSLHVEAAYRLEPSYKAGTKQLYNLYYSITNDSEDEFDYTTNSSAHDTIHSDNLILENVCDFEILALRKNFSSYSAGALQNLPYVIKITLKVIDDDGAARKQYETSDDPVRTFTRFITIDQGQEL